MEREAVVWDMRISCPNYEGTRVIVGFADKEYCAL